MIQCYPDVGLLRFLQKSAISGFKYRLYITDVTPDEDSVLGFFTELAVAGYALQQVLAADFVIQSIAGHVASIVAAPVTFTQTSGSNVNIYGYFVTDRDDDTKLMFAARFDAAPVVLVSGDVLPVLPMISDFWSH